MGPTSRGSRTGRQAIIARAGKRFLVAVALVLSTTAALGTGTAVAQDINSEILSNYENTHPGYSIDRDCGYSIPDPSRPGTDLWLFCDSIVYDQSTIEEAILGTDTAAEGPLTPGQGPQSLNELPTPPARPNLPNDNAPAPFMPLPQGLVDANGKPCNGSNDGVYPASFNGDYPAAWFTGIAQEPTVTGAGPDGQPKFLITFSLYCVVPGAQDPFIDEGWGVVDYNPATNTLGRPTYVFKTSGGQQLPVQEQFTNPVFDGGYLYLFVADCTSSYGDCLASNIYLARVAATPAAWRRAAAYQYWDGSGWSASYAAATSVISGATAFSVSVGNYSNVGKGFVLVADAGEYNTNNPPYGGLDVYTSTSLTSWTELGTDYAPLSDTCQNGPYGCYAINGHPELSTPTDLVLSYYDPGGGTNGLGHLYVASYPWSALVPPASAG